MLQLSTASLNTRAVALSSNGKYAYINSIGDNSIYKCGISNLDYSLQQCAVAKSGLSYPVERLALNFNGNVLFVNTGAGNQSCTLNNTDGSITSCTNSGAPSGAGLSFNLTNTMVYLTQSTKDVVYCQYDNATNLLTNCSAATNAISGFVTGVAFSTTYAYVTSTTDVSQCTVAPDGSFSACQPAAGSSAPKSEGITIFN